MPDLKTYNIDYPFTEDSSKLKRTGEVFKCLYPVFVDELEIREYKVPLRLVAYPVIYEGRNCSVTMFSDQAQDTYQIAGLRRPATSEGAAVKSTNFIE